MMKTKSLILFSILLLTASNTVVLADCTPMGMVTSFPSVFPIFWVSLDGCNAGSMGLTGLGIVIFSLLISAIVILVASWVKKNYRLEKRKKEKDD